MQAFCSNNIKIQLRIETVKIKMAYIYEAIYYKVNVAQ